MIILIDTKDRLGFILKKLHIGHSIFELIVFHISVLFIYSLSK